MGRSPLLSIGGGGEGREGPMEVPSPLLRGEEVEYLLSAKVPDTTHRGPLRWEPGGRLIHPGLCPVVINRQGRLEQVAQVRRSLEK